ncbi:hypothetical protein BMF94_2194 [Rhodotorula taiwanensis]|uniref:CBS domain-containing protein n=1 Tax=Rhodotorula taiwanensis TaxID=741276 RepID=A0A2S5BD83_9BASI|nr:hypothetical protein BMF94_2194 [Rhodotorula taiwanensis]
MVDYRGANIDDLQLSPALVLPVSTSVGTALQLAFERDFRQVASATRRAAQPASRKHALTRAVRITTDSILPLHSPSSRAELLGWLSIDALKPLAEKGQVNLDAPLSDLLRGDDSATTATTTTATATASSAERPAESTERPVKEFKRGRKYEVITPETPLEKLEAFFAEQQAPGGSKVQFALVTDSARKFVLGVVTADDLQKFTRRRFPNAAATTAGPGGLAPPVPS